MKKFTGMNGTVELDARIARKVALLEARIEEVPKARRSAYSEFVKNSLARIRYGASTQEIWHDWQWRGILLPAYRKSIAEAALQCDAVMLEM